MRRITLASIVTFLGIVLASAALAQVGNPSDSTIASSFGLSANTDVRLIVVNVIRYVLGFLGLLAVLVVLYGGYLWMTAGGNADRVAQGKRVLVNGAIGLVIILSAFLIVTFVLRTFNEVIDGGGGGNPPPSGCTTPPCAPFGGSLDFAVSGYQPPTRPFATTPAESMNKRTAVVHIRFTQPVDATTIAYDQGVNSTISIWKAPTRGGGFTFSPTDPVVAGTIDTTKAASGVISFRPSTPCPQPNATRTCFDADSTFWIEVKNSVKSAEATPRTVNCGSALGPGCRYTFDIGNQIDAQDPRAVINSPQSRAPLSSPGEIVKGTGSDNDGVTSLQLFTADYTGPCVASACAGDATQSCTTDNDCTKNSAQLGTDILNPATDAPFSPFSGTASWATPVPRYKNGDIVRLEAIASDFSGNTGRGSALVTLRPEHCFNGIQDTDKGETGMDCSADANNPEFCGFCAGTSCDSSGAPQCQANQSLCGSNLQCDTTSCTCQSVPIVTDYDAKDGTAGNFVTIVGSGFGTTPGTVTFLGGNRTAALATVSGCPAGANWTDNQIVIEVPTGVTDGPLEVKRPDGKFDRTNEGLGPDLANFDENGSARPALGCIIESHGKFSDTVSFLGKNFSGAGGTPDQALFGSASGGSCEGATCPGSGSGTIVTRVPNILPITVGSRVKRVSTNRLSNPINFRVEATGGEPRIDRLTPDRGPKQQYLTITGANFGRATGTVTFEKDGVNTLASTDFPAACRRDGLWSDKQILVKVPDLTAGTYNVSMERPDGEGSNVVDFEVNNDPLAPGICLVDPSKGPVGTPVDVYGERLGDGAGTSAVKFFFEKMVPWAARTDATKWLNDSGGKPAWRSGEILGVKVPPGAQDGLVSVALNGGKVCSKNPSIACTVDEVSGDSCGPANGPCIDKVSTNGLNFIVGSCSSNADCETGICCAQRLEDGSTVRSCRTSCPAPENPTVKSYRWRFTTGNPAPTVVESRECSAATQSPSPWKDSNDACTNADLSVRFSVDLNMPSLSSGVCSDHDALTLIKCDDENCSKDASGNVRGTPVNVSELFCPDERTLQRRPVVAPDLWPIPGATYYATVHQEKIISKPIPPTTVGEPMAQDYSWKFTLSERCSVKSVACSPTDATITTLAQPGSDKTLTANLQAQNCNVLSCASSDIQSWSLNPNNPTAPVVFPTPPGTACTATVRGIGETSAPSVATVTPREATATAGQCRIDVKLADLMVTNTYPSCNSACTNALIGVTFNLPLRATTAVDANLRLQKFANADCTGALSAVNFTSAVTGAVATEPNEITLAPTALEASTCYRASVRADANGVLSKDGQPIANENDPSAGWHNWTFKTGASACEVGKLETLPKQETVRTIGAERNFNSVAWSKPGNACGAERLDPQKLDFAWSSAPTDVATVTNNDTMPQQGFTDSLQTATIVGTNPQCGQGPAYRCDAQITASVIQNATPITDSGQFTLQCGFKQAGRCVSRAGVNGVALKSCTNGVGANNPVAFRETSTLPNVAGITAAVSRDEKFIYITDRNVKIINTTTRQEVGAISGTFSTPVGIAINPQKATEAYVTDRGNNSVIVLDLAQNRMVGSAIAVGQGPERVAFSQDGAFAYVTNAPANSVSVINTATQRVVATVTGLAEPQGIVAIGGSVYVANARERRIAVLDRATNTIDSHIDVVANPYGLIASPDQKRLYVGTTGSRIAVVDVATKKEVSTINANGRFENLGITPDGRYLFASALSGALYVTDLRATALSATPVTVTPGTNNHGVAVLSSGTVYLTNGSAKIISVIEPIGTCETDADCNAGSDVGVCGGGQPSGTCLASTNTCSNDPQVACLDSNGVRDDRLCRFAVNTAGCCGARPWVEQVASAKDEEGRTCQNAAFTVTFNTLMNEGSLLGSNGSCTATTGKCSNDASISCLNDQNQPDNSLCQFSAVRLERTDKNGQCGGDLAVAPKPWWRRAWDEIARFFGFEVTAAPGPYQCVVPASVITRPVRDGQGRAIKTQAVIYPQEPLEADGTSNEIRYRVHVLGESSGLGGATSRTGVQMENNYVAEFNQPSGDRAVVGSQMCAIARVDVTVEPPVSYFTNITNPQRPDRPYDVFSCFGDDCSCSSSGDGKACRLVSSPSAPAAVWVGEDQNTGAAGNQHRYTAAAKTSNGGELAATMTWGEGVCRGGSEAGKPCWQSSQCGGSGASCDQSSDPQDVIELENQVDKQLVLRNKNKNGLANVRVRATSGTGNSATSQERSVPVTVFLCQNPWTPPSPGSAPLRDSANNFMTTYCRDSQNNLLPNFAIIQPQTPPGNVLKEWILKDPGSPDAIGIRVVKNTRHVSPAQWYAEQSFPKGSPSSAVVDGYPAVIDGRTIYVGAGNATGTGSSATLFTNIYIFSYNQDAKPETINIFQQLLRNVLFNTNRLSAGQCLANTTGAVIKRCSNDAAKSCDNDSECGDGGSCQVASCLLDSDCREGSFCSSEKSGITRDTIRLSSLLDIASDLEDYRYGTACAKVTPGAPGDADCNGRVDAQDILITRSYAGGLQTFPSIGAGCRAADTNNNGSVDNSDVAAVIATVQSTCKRDASQTSNYPALNAGSYIQGITTSRWPSWDQAFSQALKEKQPIDPTNFFGSCPAYDQDGTCWSDQKKEYFCKASPAACANPATTWYPPAAPVGGAGEPRSSVFTYTSFGVCDKQRNQECLFDSDCGGNTGPCVRGDQYALCGSLEACYRPSPSVLNQKYDVTRFCQVTSDRIANGTSSVKLPAAPPAAATCSLFSDTPLVPPLLQPPSYDVRVEVVAAGGQGSVNDSVQGISLTTSTTCTTTSPCSDTASVIEGTPMEIDASPTSGSVIWSGCDRVVASGVRRICEVVANRARTVRATFSPPAPIISISTNKSVIKEGESVSLTVSAANVSSVISFTANGIPVTCSSGSVGATGGTCVISGQNDTVTYRITVRNASGVQASATATVYINTPPTLSIPQAFQPSGVVMGDGDISSITVRGHDPDGCSTPYTYIITQQPGFSPAVTTPGSLSCASGALQGTITYRPNAGSSGSTTLKYKISDGANLSQERTVNITVQ